MNQPVSDQMTEHALSSLASGDEEKLRKLVYSMAMRWPGEPALHIAFAITSAAASLEDVLHGTSVTNAASTGYRLAALVAADTYAIVCMGKPNPVGTDLLHFWRRVDPYFLRLAGVDGNRR